MAKWIWIGVAVLAVGVAIARSGTKRPAAQTVASTAAPLPPPRDYVRAPDPVPAPAPQPPPRFGELLTYAELLSQEYHANELKAQRSNGGRRYDVIGRVDSVEIHLGKVHVYLRGGSYRRVSITMAQEALDQAAELKRGQEVVIDARVDGAGVMGTVMMSDGIFPTFDTLAASYPTSDYVKSHKRR